MWTLQVTEETCKILQNFGYIFEQRGLVTVKGKGQLMTYYLIGKGDNPPQITTDSAVITGKEGTEGSVEGNFGITMSNADLRSEADSNVESSDTKLLNSDDKNFEV